MEISNETVLLSWQALNEVTVKGSQAKVVSVALEELQGKLLEAGILQEKNNGDSNGSES